MEPVELVGDGDTVVGRFQCSATHEGEWRGHPPTGRRFENLDEVYFCGFEGGRIARLWVSRTRSTAAASSGSSKSCPRTQLQALGEVASAGGGPASGTATGEGGLARC